MSTLHDIRRALEQLDPAQQREISGWLAEKTKSEATANGKPPAPPRPRRPPDSLRIFRVVFQNSLDAIIIGSPQGIVSAANPAACRLLRMTEKEIKEAGRRGVVDPADPRLKEALRETGKTGRFRGELTFLRKDGTRFEGEVAAAVFHDENAVARTVVIIRDRTDERRAEAALRESEERYRFTFDQSPLGTAIVSLDYRFVRVNESLARITGYPAAELATLRFADITHEEDLEVDHQQALELKAGRIDRYVVEKRFVRKDRSLVWVHFSSRLLRDEDGSPLGYLALIQDISQRRESEEQLRILTERLALAAKAADLGVWDWDLRTQVTTWNHRMYEIYGIDPSVRVTRAVWRRNVHPEDLERTEASLDKAIERRESLIRAFRVRLPDGEIRHIESTEGVVLDDQGTVIRVVGINRDVTKRKHAEEERERLIAELRQALAEVKTLSGLLPMCAWCHKVRDDAGYWDLLESYLRRHTDAKVTHGICDDCLREHTGEHQIAPSPSSSSRSSS
jgi:PAS domain S-box-containing protein